MKPSHVKELIQNLKDRGYVEKGDVFYTPEQAKSLNLKPQQKKKRGKNIVKTGDIYDERNIKNQQGKQDQFMMLSLLELKILPWREFYFTTERQFRLDYAFPEYKIGLEINGGVWSKGNSGHSSGTGIKRDYEKNNLLQSLGWKTITITPDQLMTTYTLNLISTMMLEVNIKM